MNLNHQHGRLDFRQVDSISGRTVSISSRSVSISGRASRFQAERSRFQAVSISDRSEKNCAKRGAAVAQDREPRSKLRVGSPSLKNVLK